MARSEVIEKRGRNSKTFREDDGTFTLEIGPHHHHLSGGAMVETDCNWRDLAAEFASGVYPYTVTLNKASRSVTVSDGAQTVTLAPYNGRNPTSVTRSGDTITLVRLWTGVTCRVRLLPERLLIQFIRTATTYVNPAFTVTGDHEPMMQARYDGADGPVAVPVTYSSGRVTYELSGVPVGAVVY